MVYMIIASKKNKGLACTAIFTISSCFLPRLPCYTPPTAVPRAPSSLEHSSQIASSTDERTTRIFASNEAGILIFIGFSFTSKIARTICDHELGHLAPHGERKEIRCSWRTSTSHQNRIVPTRPEPIIIPTFSRRITKSNPTCNSQPARKPPPRPPLLSPVRCSLLWPWPRHRQHRPQGRATRSASTSPRTSCMNSTSLGCTLAGRALGPRLGCFWAGPALLLLRWRRLSLSSPLTPRPRRRRKRTNQRSLNPKTTTMMTRPRRQLTMQW